jgi:hypothetical protein
MSISLASLQLTKCYLVWLVGLLGKGVVGVRIRAAAGGMATCEIEGRLVSVRLPSVEIVFHPLTRHSNTISY